jgi:hypothetical protein
LVAKRRVAQAAVTMAGFFASMFRRIGIDKAGVGRHAEKHVRHPGHLCPLLYVR